MGCGGHCRWHRRWLARCRLCRDRRASRARSLLVRRISAVRADGMDRPGGRGHEGHRGGARRWRRPVLRCLGGRCRARDRTRCRPGRCRRGRGLLGSGRDQGLAVQLEPEDLRDVREPRPLRDDLGELEEQEVRERRPKVCAVDRRVPGVLREVDVAAPWAEQLHCVLLWQVAQADRKNSVTVTENARTPSKLRLLVLSEFRAM